MGSRSPVKFSDTISFFIKKSTPPHSVLLYNYDLKFTNSRIYGHRGPSRSRKGSWVNGGGLGEVVHPEEGGSILIFDRDVVRCDLIPLPIATRLGAADEFGHANDKVLRSESGEAVSDGY